MDFKKIILVFFLVLFGLAIFIYPIFGVSFLQLIFFALYVYLLIVIIKNYSHLKLILIIITILVFVSANLIAINSIPSCGGGILEGNRILQEDCTCYGITIYPTYSPGKNHCLGYPQVISKDNEFSVVYGMKNYNQKINLDVKMLEFDTQIKNISFSVKNQNIEHLNFKINFNITASNSDTGFIKDKSLLVNQSISFYYDKNNFILKPNDDKIFDVSIELREEGTHLVSLEVIDVASNELYAKKTFFIKKQK
jgi:hypothetical protein